MGLASGGDVLGSCQLDMARAYAIAACPGLFDNFGDVSEPSIVCVVTPLTAIIKKDQVSLEFQCSLLHAGPRKLTVVYL